MKIPVYRPDLSGREKEYVNQCLDTSWISSRGEFIERFENAFARFIGVPHATSVHNGTVAIHLALLAIGIQPGDEVIVPAFTYIASVNTIIHAGATPVFVDSVEDTWQIDIADVARKITPRTKAVMAVHLYGQACAIEQLADLCRQRGIKLVEDCAEAFGTYSSSGRHVGTLGDVSTFSFFGNKTITTGEGGMVVSPHADVAKRAAHLKNQGVIPGGRMYWHDMVAYNYRMTNIQAAIGLAQIERAPQILEAKQRLAALYREGLQGLPLRLHSAAPGTVHSHWMISIALHDINWRDDLRAALDKAGIETRPAFYLATVFPMYERYGGSFPVAERLSASALNLPSFPTMRDAEVAYVCDAVRAFCLSHEKKTA